MIFIRLAGGLGNQLFELAAAMALQREPSEQIVLDVDSLARYAVARTFDLSNLLVLPDHIGVDTPCGVLGRAALGLLRLRAGRLLPRYGVGDRDFAAHLAQRQGSGQSLLWVDGYFQVQWPAPVLDAVLKRMLTMMRSDLPTSRATSADVALHIRGGDFLTNLNYRVTDATYYVKAMSRLREQVNRCRDVVVVTDDPAYANMVVGKMQEAHADLNFMEAPAARAAHGLPWLQDFALLRDAPARLIGNSSFAWWAAALDPRHAPTVSPDRWTRVISRDLALPWETLMSS